MCGSSAICSSTGTVFTGRYMARSAPVGGWSPGGRRVTAGCHKPARTPHKAAAAPTLTDDGRRLTDDGPVAWERGQSVVSGSLGHLGRRARTVRSEGRLLADSLDGRVGGAGRKSCRSWTEGLEEPDGCGRRRGLLNRWVWSTVKANETNEKRCLINYVCLSVCQK